jgi:hypothetical protein
MSRAIAALACLASAASLQGAVAASDDGSVLYFGALFRLKSEREQPDFARGWIYRYAAGK